MVEPSELQAYKEGLIGGMEATIKTLEDLRVDPGVPGSAVEGFNLAIDCARSALLAHADFAVR